MGLRHHLSFSFVEAFGALEDGKCHVFTKIKTIKVIFINI